MNGQWAPQKDMMITMTSCVLLTYKHETERERGGKRNFSDAQLVVIFSEGELRKILNFLLWKGGVEAQENQRPGRWKQMLLTLSSYVIIQGRQKANESCLMFRHFTTVRYVCVTNKSSLQIVTLAFKVDWLIHCVNLCSEQHSRKYSTFKDASESHSELNFFFDQ